VFATGLVPAVVAQEAEKKEEPAKDAAAAPAKAPETAPAAEEKPAAPAAAPAAETTPATEAKPTAVPAAEAPKKALSPSALALQPLADSYKKAYEDMQAWITAVDAKTSPANDSVMKLQAEVVANGDATTKAKLAGDNAKVKELTKQNKQLMSALEAAKKTAATAAGPVAKEASDRVKQYGAASDQALTELKAKTK
jgi:hypothetical protein